MPADDRSGPRPPRPLRWLLGRLLPRRDRAHLLLEMDDLYARRALRAGLRSALRWYVWRLPGFPARLVVDGCRAVARALLAGVASTAWDVRHGARVLRRRPAYTAANVVTLGIGIGGVATVYAVANWVLLRPVPGVEDPDSLVTLQLVVKDPRSPAFPISEPDRRALADGDGGALRGLVGSHEVDLNAAFAADARPRRVASAVVSDGYFHLLGVRPAAGRLFGGEKGGVESDSATVVISRELWREEWGEARSVLGTSVRIDGRRFTVIGVAPTGFHGAELPGRVQLWVPAGALSLVDPGYGPEALSARGRPVWTGLVGRPSPGNGPASVEEEAVRTIDEVRATYRAHSYTADFTFRAYKGVGLSPRLRAPVRRTLTLLAGAAGFLLLLALANVTNLGLAHGSARAVYAAVQAALGAGRARIARRVLAEQALLGLSGGGAGIGVAVLGCVAFRNASLSELGASLEGIHLDGGVAAFTSVAALAAALVAGLVPAAAAGTHDLLASLSGHRQGARHTHRVQSVLVVTQVALSTLLLVGAGLFVRTVINLRSADVGFEPDRALRFSIDPQLQGYDDPAVRSLIARVEAGLSADPGVVAVGFVSPAPIRPSYYTDAVFPAGGTPEEDLVRGAQLQVTPGFLEAAGARFVAGRDFETDEDRALSPATETPVVISTGVARGAWPGLVPSRTIGRTLLTPGRRPGSLRVIGVVEDLRFLGVTAEVPPLVIYPWRGGVGGVEVTGWVRARGRPEDIAPRVRSVVGALDASLPVYGLRSARSSMDDLIVEERVITRLAVGLALVGLLLAGVGLHGVLGYAVTQRRRELGVRAALGAGPAQLVAPLVARGLLLTCVGAATGGVAAAALTRAIASRLFEVTPLDPLTWGAGAALLLAAATLAAWSPARRSTRVSPREALAAE